MSVGDAEYQQWLQTDGQHRTVLVVAEHSAGTEYFSTSPFISESTDALASIPFVDILVDIPRINRSINGATSFGNLEVINDGTLDDWIDYKWRGYSIDIFFGDKDWDFNDFRLVLSGINDGIYRVDNQRIDFGIFDKRRLFDVNLPMTDTNYEQKIPIALGIPFNVGPILKDHTAQEYYIHDGTCTATNVRDNGVDINANVTDAGDGTFTLSPAIAGEISADITEANDTLSEMVLDVCDRISFTDIDTDQINAFVNVSPLGLYVDRETRASTVMDTICNSFGAFWSFSREGLLQITQFDDTLTTADHIIYVDDIVDGQGSIDEVIDPEETTQLNYRKNWKPQTEDGLAGSVATPDFITLYTNEWSFVSKTNTLTGYPIPIENDPIDTLIISSTNAQTECDRRAAIRAEKRKVFRFNCFSAPFLYEVGDIVEINYSRFGLDGVNMKIIEMTEYPTDNRVSLTLWM